MSKRYLIMVITVSLIILVPVLYSYSRISSHENSQYLAQSDRCCCAYQTGPDYHIEYLSKTDCDEYKGTCVENETCDSHPDTDTGGDTSD
jgi:hypothetical protein